jgi:restriction endonuclease S subunit
LNTQNKLPKDWKTVKLEDLLDYIQPTKYIVKSTEYDDSYKTPVLTAGKTFILGKTNETEGVFENLPVIIFDDFTTANKLVNFKFKVKSSAMKILKPKDKDVNLLFVYYYIQTIRISFDTHKRYWISVFSKLPIALPIPESQQAIVSKIEELFSELDKGIEDLKTAQQQLKTYRQSVLKWAFEGKLTNENIKDGELPKGWKYVNIEDIAKVGTGATPLKGNKSYYENGKIAWVTSGALNDEYVRNATDYVTELALKETNLSLYPKHTLLLAMYGEGKTRGKCSELLIEATTNQAIAAISFENHDINAKPFLKYFLLKNYNDIRMLSSGGVQPNLNLGIVKKTQLPFPPIEEQHLIVQEIESRLSVADKMEESITQSLQQAEALRKSILKKAFSGELV